jgi:hypothetical protein
MGTSCKPGALLVLLGAALILLAGFAGHYDAGYDAGVPVPSAASVGGNAAPPGALPPDPTIVRVFVVWGSSNACGSAHPNPPNSGQEPASPDPAPNTAYEWHWSDQFSVASLDDPMPCWGTDHSGQGTDHSDKGSAWPRFAITYNDETGGPTDGDIVFMTSVARGGSGVIQTPGDCPPGEANSCDWSPNSTGELYDDGIAAIDAAIQRAETDFSDKTIVFGGVLWNDGGDVEDDLPPWDDYRSALHDLLSAFGTDVANNPERGGRFYFINTVIPGAADYPDDEALKRETDLYLDLEADVCSEYTYCSMIQESAYIKVEQRGCIGHGAPYTLTEALCGGWFTPPNGFPDLRHWGQRALNHLGQKTAEAAFLHGTGDPFPFEVGVEVPQRYDDDATYRLEVYKSDGTTPVDGSPFTITPQLRNPDWTADFDGSDPDADWSVPSWASLSTEFLTFEFYRVPTVGDPQHLARYVYVPSALAYGAGAENFYRPEATTGPAETRFEVYMASPGVARVRAKTAFVGAFFEDVFAAPDLYVVPYNHRAACNPNCPFPPPGYFLARVPETGPPPTYADQEYTFAREADVVIPSGWGPVPWNVPGLTLRFPDDRRLVVEGALDATGVTLTKAAGALGWGGVVFRQPPSGASTLASGFHGVVVESVRRPTGQSTPRGSVEVAGRTLTVDGESEVHSGANGAVGLLATGTDAEVTVTGFSQIRNNTGGGVYATGGAHVTVDGQSQVEDNGVGGAGGGVRADGFGTQVNLAGVSILDNTGIGVRALSQGYVLFANGDTAPRTTVQGNFGGLYGAGGGVIDAGQCPGGVLPCPGRNVHLISGNNQGFVYYDGQSISSAMVYAEGNEWDVTAMSQLRLQEGAGSELTVCPIVNVPNCTDPAPLVGGGGSGASGQGGAGSAGAARAAGGAPRRSGGDGRLTDVLALVDEAERAHLEGDMAAFEVAALAVVAAIDSSATEDERRAAFEATARLFAWAQPAEPLGALEALAAEPGDAHPWSQRALGVTRASAGDYAGAGAAADTLVGSYAGSEHAAFGYVLSVRVAVEEEDEAAAVAALLALAARFPESEAVGSLAALVVGAFPEADLSELEGVLGGGLRTPEGVGATSAPSSTGATSAVSGVAGALLDVGEARPNPATSTASVPFALSAEARVEAALYDVRGRRVALLSSGAYGAGRHVLTFDGTTLPSGLYVVHVVARGAQGTSAAVRRITITR